jgi:hypothetical protein
MASQEALALLAVDFKDCRTRRPTIAPHIGAVLALEISRLAGNGREWHTLMEFCAVVGTLLMDEHGVYDQRLTNDQSSRAKRYLTRGAPMI